MKKSNMKSISHKKDIKNIFTFIFLISLSVVVFGYLFKFASFIFSLNGILGVGVYVFVILSIIGVFYIILALSGGLDKVEK